MLKKNRTGRYVSFLFILCFFAGINSSATKRYWVGNGTNKNWNSTGNWSATSGGASGASVPVSTDSVYFDGSGTGQCSINATVSIKRLEIGSGYTDTVKQNVNTITVGTSGMVLSGGVFKGGSATISDEGVFTLSGTDFISTSSTITIEGNYNFSAGTFTPNNGTVLFNTTCSITGSTTFYRLTLSTSGANATYSIAAGTTLTCINLFRTDGINQLSVNTGNIVAQGDLTANNGHSSITSGGNATITINGTGNQLFTGRGSAGLGKLCNVTIDKASGTLTLKDFISVNGNWKYLQGTLDVTTYTSDVGFYNTSSTHRITGKHTLGNVSFVFTAANNALVIPAGDTLTVNGTLTTAGTLNGRLDSGVVSAKGHITLMHTHVNFNGNATIYICGTGGQTFTGTTIGQGRIPHVKINKPSGTLTLRNTITVFGHWTYLAGTIDGATFNGTVAFAAGTRNITGSHSLYNVTFYASGSASTNNLGSGDTLTVLGELKLDGSSFATVNTGVLNVQGDLTIANTSSSGGAGSATFNICGTGTQTFTGSGVSNVGYISHIKVNKPSGILNLSNIISLGAVNWTYVAGDVEEGTSTVLFYGSGNVSCKNGAASMSFNNMSVQNGTRTLTSTLKAKGLISIASGKVLNAANNEIHLAGNWSNSGTYTSSGSTLVLNGTGDQFISKSSGTEVVDTLEIKKAGGKAYLNCPVIVNKKLMFTKGVIATSATNYLNFADDAICDLGKDTSYVCGPVRKTGNDAFVFPLGDTLLSGGAYHPLGISAPGNVTDVFTAWYHVGTVSDSTAVDSISLAACEYWTIARNTGKVRPASIR